MPQIVEAIAKSRREANKVKREQPITVVIGNPPYKEKAEGRGGWIEKGAGGKLHAPLDRWKAPPEWGVGAHGKHLKNLYVYFWRWATLKVFGSGRFAATGLPDTDEEGIVCFITVAGFLNGPGFEKMRDDLRRTCSDIWVIDCSPEGHQPDVPTRIFQGVQQPVCIVLAARKLGKDDKTAGACAVSRAAEGQAGGKVQGARGAVARREGLDRLSGGLARALPAGVRWKVGGFRAACATCSPTTARASCPAGRGSSRRTRRHWKTLGAAGQREGREAKGRAVSSALRRAVDKTSTKASNSRAGRPRISLAFHRERHGESDYADALCVSELRSAVDHSGRID